MNSSDAVHIDAYQTSDHFVFAVFRNGRQWKRLLPKGANKAGFWIERNRDGLHARVSGKSLSWLNGILQRQGEFPKVRRFPRLGSSSPVAGQK